MSEKPINPLRQRMLEDMNMRRFVPDTQCKYIRAVKRLAIFLGRPPDSATAEELRAFPTASDRDGCPTTERRSIAQLLAALSTAPTSAKAIVIGAQASPGATGARHHLIATLSRLASTVNTAIKSP
jgi:Phage integrase, N-terminal SAM-like domain